MCLGYGLTTHNYHHSFFSYEPELFPGLIYRMVRPRIVLLIFVSGKVVLTGAVPHPNVLYCVGSLLKRGAKNPCFCRCQGATGDHGRLFKHLPHFEEIQENLTLPRHNLVFYHKTTDLDWLFFFFFGALP